MADQNSIRIGRDATGPVVAGRYNVVESQQPTATQENSAKDEGTVYAVTNGDLHVAPPDRAD